MTSQRVRTRSHPATVYSYIVTFDSGFSPNPFHGVCTLACCKPNIRRAAQVGDVVIGLSSLGLRFVYAMQISRVIDFATYWNDPQYAAKRPVKGAPFVLAGRGDNIYQPWAIGEFRQLPSLHSEKDGTEHLGMKRRDLGGLHVLVADSYAYFGSEGPPVPDDFAFLRIGRGHRCKFTGAQVAQVWEWFTRLPQGVHGRPALWPSADDSWREA